MKLVLAVLIVLLVVGGASFVYMNRNNTGGNVGQDNSSNLPGSYEQAEVLPANDSDVASGSISLDELANHDSESDCWIVYDGKVYDVTSYLPKHPGSAGAIVPTCGSAEKFTTSFEGKHGKSKVGLLMKVGTFIGYFDVVGNLASPSNSPTQNQNLVIDQSYNSDIDSKDYEYEDDEDSDKENEDGDEEEDEIEDDD